MIDKKEAGSKRSPLRWVAKPFESTWPVTLAVTADYIGASS